nr:unnamed protein product [Callosobruchus analis]
MYHMRPLTLCMLFAYIFLANSSDPTFEIVTGNCTNPPVSELILQRRLRSEAPPKPGHLEQLVSSFKADLNPFTPKGDGKYYLFRKLLCLVNIIRLLSIRHKPQPSRGWPYF